MISVWDRPAHFIKATKRWRCPWEKTETLKLPLRRHAWDSLLAVSRALPLNFLFGQFLNHRPRFINSIMCWENSWKKKRKRVFDPPSLSINVVKMETTSWWTVSAVTPPSEEINSSINRSGRRSKPFFFLPTRRTVELTPIRDDVVPKSLAHETVLFYWYIYIARFLPFAKGDRWWCAKRNVGALGSRRSCFTEPERSNGNTFSPPDVKRSTASSCVGLMWFHNVNIRLMKGVIDAAAQTALPPRSAFFIPPPRKCVNSLHLRASVCATNKQSALMIRTRAPAAFIPH